MQTTEYTLAQEKKLLRIKQGPNQKAELEKLATKWGKAYPSLYAKWNTVLKAAGQWQTNATSPTPITKKRITVVAAGEGKEIQPFVLEEGAEMPRRGDRASTLAIKEALRPLLDKMEPRKHSIPVYKVNRATIRKFLTDEFPNKVFTIAPIKDNKEMVRIFRRS